MLYSIHLCIYSTAVGARRRGFLYFVAVVLKLNESSMSLESEVSAKASVVGILIVGLRKPNLDRFHI